MDYLAEEMRRKHIPKQKVEILKDFSTQLQQEQQSSVQGGPSSSGPDKHILCRKKLGKASFTSK